jgi:hypothetical protein
VAALRDALLQHLDELEQPFRLLAAMPHRRLLAWLVLLLRLNAMAFSTARHGWRGESWAPAREQAAMRRLVELTGKDPARARQDVAWMVGQLGPAASQSIERRATLAPPTAPASRDIRIEYRPLPT